MTAYLWAQPPDNRVDIGPLENRAVGYDWLSSEKTYYESGSKAWLWFPVAQAFSSRFHYHVCSRSFRVVWRWRMFLATGPGHHTPM